MNGKLEDWVQRLDDKVDNHESRINSIETYQEQFAEKMDERYDAFKWYMRWTLGVAVTILASIVIKTIFKL